MAKYAILQSFYASEAWIRLRLSLILERGPYCQKCGNLIPNHLDIIGHHKKELTPENVNDVMISLNPDNILLVCRDCHNAIHGRYNHQIDRAVYIVYGPPLSGKSTYVQTYKNRNDIAVDMDRLYTAVTMLPCYDKPQPLFTNVIGIYNQLIDNIRTRYGKWETAWVIGGYAERHKRERLADDLGAELIFCDVSKEECLRRLEADTERQFRKDEWTGFIEEWFEKYSA